MILKALKASVRTVGFCLVCVALVLILLANRLLSLVGLCSAVDSARLADRLANWIWTGIVKHLESGGGEFYFSGDDVPVGESAIVVCNHRMTLDWMMIFVLAAMKGRLGCCKFFAKNSIKHIPGVGWGMYLLGSVFLARNWADDIGTIERTFSDLKSLRLPLWMISWPEGTRITPTKLKISQNFCRERGEYVLQNLLYPRTKGFVATLLGLGSNVDAVYDITIAYENDCPPELMDVASGDINRKIFLHTRRFPVGSLSKDPEALKQFCINLFREKDALIDHFKQHGEFPGAVRRPLVLPPMELEQRPVPTATPSSPSPSRP